MGDDVQGREICAFTDSKPVVIVTGGSQGAESINRTVRAGLDRLLKQFNLCHICGQGGLDATLVSRPGYKQFEYVDEELPHLLAIADVVVTRAGATTIFELLELRKPNLLIPLTLGQSRGDQILNARSFEKRGFSQVLMEEDLSVDTLAAAILQVYAERETMLATMGVTASVNGTHKVIGEIMRYIDD